MMNKEKYAIRNAKIVELAQSGFTTIKIAQEFGITPSRVSQILNRNNSGIYKAKPRKFTDEQLIELINKECTFKECANILGVHNNSVVYRAAKLGLRSPKYVSPETEEKMLHFRECGYSNKIIAQRTGFTTSAVLSHIGKQPKEITDANRESGWKKRTVKTEAIKKARATMIEKREAERLAAIEAERIRLEAIQREEERKSVQIELNEILGFEHTIATAEEGRELILRVARKFERSVAA